MIILFFVDDQAHVVRLELDLIELGVKLPDLTLNRDALWLLSKPANLTLDFLGPLISIRNPVQLVEPPKYLAIRQRNDFLILSGFNQRQG